MASSFLVAVGFFVARKMGHPVPSTTSLLITVASDDRRLGRRRRSSPPPTERATLVDVLQRGAPGGTRLARRSARNPDVNASPDSLAQSLLGWVLGCTFVYAALFGTGSFLYGRTPQGMMWLAVFIATGVGLIRLFPRLWPAGAGGADAA